MTSAVSVPVAPAVPDVLAENLEELAFLSLQRRKLLFDYETTIEEIGEHDERIEAQRDSLRIGGETSVRLAEELISEGFLDWEIYAGARVWLEQARPGRPTLEEKLAGGTGPGWIEAFRRVPPEIAADLLNPVALPEPMLPLAVDALLWHGLLDDRRMFEYARHADAGNRRTVARHLGGRMRKRVDSVDLLRELSRDDDVDVRRAALGSLAACDRGETLRRCREELQAVQPDDFALRLTGLLGETDDLARLVARAPRPAALRALGDLGDPAALDVLLEALGSDDVDTALAATDGLTLIVGPPSASATAEEGEAPDPEELRRRAKDARGSIADGTRHWAGIPLADDWPPEGDLGVREPVERQWRKGLAGVADPVSLHLGEVPDGFFTGAPSEVSVAGE